MMRWLTDVNENGSGASPPPEPPWLRRAELIAYVFLFTCISSGLICVYFGGSVLNALIGAAITVGGSGAAWIMLAVVRIGSLVDQNASRLEAISQRVDALEDTLEVALHAVPDENQAAAEVADVDLSDVGTGDPGPLVAASLPADRFPRLAVQDAAPTSERREAEAAGAQTPGPDGRSQAPGAAPARQDSACEPAVRPPPNDPEVRWQHAFERGDIRACRRILAEAGSRIEPARRAAMNESLGMLADDRRQTLRDQFARLVREGRFGQALAKGEEIAEAFPNSSLAAEFERIQPHLVRRAAEQPPRAAER